MEKEKKMLELRLDGKEYVGHVETDGGSFYGFVAGDNIIVGGKERKNICKVMGVAIPGALRVIKYAPRSNPHGDVVLFDMVKTGKVSLADVQEGGYVGSVYRIDHNAFDNRSLQGKDLTDMLKRYANINPMEGTATLG